ncbi:hypothetical protein B0H21DRAFT_212768 [Amylocystis lapponica]|nr:hypothetical protein B0H21DRAFT_212768 [Amylocystis lapponica]
MVPARLPCTPRYSSKCTHSVSRRLVHHAPKRGEADNRASLKLFEDAAREEAEDAKPVPPSRVSILEGQNDNWTGEESMQDAVLRMLVDKYKPLRSGPVRTADEKLKQAPPKVHALDSLTGVAGSSSVEEENPRSSIANKPLLPSIEGHQPWHTTFKVPTHATSSIKYGQFPPRSRKAAPISSSLDERAQRKEREVRRRTEQAGRLSRARESTLDYRLGLKGGTTNQLRRPNPVSLKGWASLVEDRIERARQEGHFRSLKGRGQPLALATAESNPFIAREEFLMNRIVQKNGAAPPWVETQGELESAVSSFREMLKESWIRRAIRMLTISQPPALLPALTLTDVTSLRDADWEAKERRYHDAAVEELNALVRKYNGLAPYAVRKSYYMRDAELEKAYRESGEEILRGLAERARSSGRRTRASEDLEDRQGAVSVPITNDNWSGWRLRDMVQNWVTALRGK